MCTFSRLQRLRTQWRRRWRLQKNWIGLLSMSNLSRERRLQIQLRTRLLTIGNDHNWACVVRHVMKNTPSISEQHWTTTYAIVHGVCITLTVNEHQCVKDKLRSKNGGNYTDILPVKAARRDNISNLTLSGASNLTCRQTECRFVYIDRLGPATLMPLIVRWTWTKFCEVCMSTSL